MKQCKHFLKWIFYIFRHKSSSNELRERLSNNKRLIHSPDHHLLHTNEITLLGTIKNSLQVIEMSALFSFTNKCWYYDFTIEFAVGLYYLLIGGSLEATLLLLRSLTPLDLVKRPTKYRLHHLCDDDDDGGTSYICCLSTTPSLLEIIIIKQIKE